jgi:hypothetical protein
MKKLTVTLLAAITVAAGARADDDLDQMLMLMRTYQALNSINNDDQDRCQRQVYVAPQYDYNAIYTAYPNNPQLWRYLNRNPRYIPLYLGNQ